MIELKLYASFEEKVAYLRKKGFTIGKRTETMTWSVYHNDTESEDVEIWYVQKNGQDFHKPWSNFGTQEWVDNAFESEIESNLKKFLLSL